MTIADLDTVENDGRTYDPTLHGGVAPGPVDIGLGDPDVVFAVEDIPGNEYPRKVTLYMNFVGADLRVGSDNSAENRSTLAKQGPYPVFSGGEQTAAAAAQEMANDVAQFGIRVVYLPDDRPPSILPYTMAMIGGNWTDTNLEDSAGGVAPGTDCGALGQRHVVYTFAGGGWGATAIANVTAQEAGHAWGLDHSLNCGSVMSYCGAGNGNFSSTCDGLCEASCQGLSGCRLFHEQFCGEGNDQQNEAAELDFLFGNSEPDLEPPLVEIQSPIDGAQIEVGGEVDLRAVVDDNFGGYGWSFRISRDGEVLHDEVAYDRRVDDLYRAALNLTGLEVGTYSITATVMDHGDNVSTDTVTFVVGDGAVDDGADGDPDGSGDADGGDRDGSGGDDSDVSAGGTAETGDDAAESSAEGTDGASGAMDDGVDGGGCECTSNPRRRGGVWWLMLPILVRRRLFWA